MIGRKRRKLQANPYTINFLEEKKTYNISFNYNKKYYSLEISKELYSLFDKFELEDISYMNKYDRHIEHLPLDEIQLHKRISNREKSLEETVIENIEKQRLYTAIDKLPQIQRKRIYLYYFNNMTQKEIAAYDGCSIRAVQYSLDIAIKNLKNFLK